MQIRVMLLREARGTSPPGPVWADAVTRADPDSRGRPRLSAARPMAPAALLPRRRRRLVVCESGRNQGMDTFLL
jgi:hypothetical protein